MLLLCLLQVKTSFKEFATVVCDDPRSATLDAGNVKLTYNALIEKVSFSETVSHSNVGVNFPQR